MSNPALPFIDRTVGVPKNPERKRAFFLKYVGNDENEWTEFEDDLAEWFNNPWEAESLGDLLLEKTPRDFEIMGWVNEAATAYLREYGRPETRNIPLPEDHIFFVKEGGIEQSTRERLRVGSHSTIGGTIIVDRRASDIPTAITTFHQVWHARGYNAVQVTTGGKVRDYRSGVSVRSRDGEKFFFYRLNEALTGLATKRFVEERLRNEPSLQREFKLLEGAGEIIDTTRMKEVKDFEYLVDRLWEANRDTCREREDVIRRFFNAQVQGNLMPAMRLIKQHQGKDAIRKIGERF